MAKQTLNDSDLMYLMTLLRSSDRPMSTREFVEALKDRAKT